MKHMHSPTKHAHGHASSSAAESNNARNVPALLGEGPLEHKAVNRKRQSLDSSGSIWAICTQDPGPRGPMILSSPSEGLFREPGREQGSSWRSELLVSHMEGRAKPQPHQPPALRAPWVAQRHGTTWCTQLLPASPPPLPGRLDPWAVSLPFPPEELPLDTGLGALQDKGQVPERQGTGPRGPGAKDEGLFPYKKNAVLPQSATGKLISLRHFSGSQPKDAHVFPTQLTKQKRPRKMISSFEFGTHEQSAEFCSATRSQLSQRAKFSSRQAHWTFQVLPGACCLTRT